MSLIPATPPEPRRSATPREPHPIAMWLDEVREAEPGWYVYPLPINNSGIAGAIRSGSGSYGVTSPGEFEVVTRTRYKDGSDEDPVERDDKGNRLMNLHVRLAVR